MFLEIKKKKYIKLNKLKYMKFYDFLFIHNFHDALKN